MLLDCLDQPILEVLGQPIPHLADEVQSWISCGKGVDRSVTVLTQTVAVHPVMVSRYQVRTLIMQPRRASLCRRSITFG